MKAEVDQLYINKLTNVPWAWSNSLEKLSDSVDNEVAKNTKFKTLKAKGNNLEKKVPDATTLTHINQYSNKQNLEEKIVMLTKNTRYE